jgi:hypothetical protein
MKTRKAFLVLAGALAAGSSVYADKVTLSSTPPSVQQAIRAKAGTREIEDIDRDQRNGQTTYEASWKNEVGAQQELLVSDTGKILRDIPSVAASSAVTSQNLTASSQPATTVALSDTPRAVQAAVYAQLPSAPIESVQRKTSWNGTTFYEVAYHDNGQARTYRVDASGKTFENFRGGRAEPRYGTAETNLALTGPEKMTFDQSPRAVQRTINQIANGAPIDAMERAQWNGRSVYASTFRRNGETVQLQVFEDGSVVTKTPGVTLAKTISTPATTTTKKPSFWDKAADLFNKQETATTTTAPAPSLRLADAPTAVQQTVNQSMRGAVLQDLQKTQWNGRNLYEAAFQQNGQAMKLQVLDDGSILSMGPSNTAVGGPASGTSGTGRGN